MPFISFQQVSVNRVRVSKKTAWTVDLSQRVWGVETNLEWGPGGWWGGEQPRSRVCEAKMLLCSPAMG